MEKQEFAALMIQLAKRIPKYAPDFTDRTNLAAWYDPLKEIPFELLRETCEFAAHNLEEWPSLAWLIKKCKGTSLSHDEVGLEISSRIEYAIGAFGYSNENLASCHIGELGWEVVKQLGGWSRVCDIESNDQLPAFRKQWRDLGKVISKKFHQNGSNLPPSLPQSNFSSVKFLEMVEKEDQE